MVIDYIKIDIVQFRKYQILKESLGYRIVLLQAIENLQMLLFYPIDVGIYRVNKHLLHLACTTEFLTLEKTFIIPTLH